MPAETEQNDTGTTTTPATGDEGGNHKESNELGEAGQRAIQRERDARKAADEARKAAEKDAREAKAALEAKNRSEDEQREHESEESKRRNEAANETLRKANLRLALVDKAGLTGAKAKAAVRLLDGLEYDSDNEPTNLEARIDAAKAEFGAEVFTGATPAAGNGTGSQNGDKDKTEQPDLHQGNRESADPTEDEQFDAYMRQNFPKVARQPAGSSSS